MVRPTQRETTLRPKTFLRGILTTTQPVTATRHAPTVHLPASAPANAAPRHAESPQDPSMAHTAYEAKPQKPVCITLRILIIGVGGWDFSFRTGLGIGKVGQSSACLGQGIQTARPSSARLLGRAPRTPRADVTLHYICNITELVMMHRGSLQPLMHHTNTRHGPNRYLQCLL